MAGEGWVYQVDHPLTHPLSSQCYVIEKISSLKDNGEREPTTLSTKTGLGFRDTLLFSRANWVPKGKSVNVI